MNGVGVRIKIGRLSLCGLIAIFVLMVDWSWTEKQTELKIEYRTNGLVFWNEMKVSKNDGYILVGTFEQGWSLIKRDGSFFRKMPGMYSTFLPSGDVVTYIRDQEGDYFAKVRGYRKAWQVSGMVTHEVSFYPPENSSWYLALEFETYKGLFTKVDTINGVDEEGRNIFYWRANDHFSEISKLSKVSFEKPRVFEKAGSLQRPSHIFTHINGFQIIPPNGLEKNHPEFRAGNILVTEAAFGMVFIISRQSGEVIWIYRNEAKPSGIHTAHWLDSDRILIFSNLSMLSESPQVSAAEEIDPISRKIVWAYTEPPIGKMRCDKYGSVQRRDNGNTLISYGCDNSAITEITSSGEIVWKWQYPQSDMKTGKPVQVYRAQWIPNSLVEKWMETQ
ncbi:MAG: hypothetical protein IPL83_12055 [Bdellovibrionales bacterium]|nr:hypothetical protein [Bdellovibrionales bacterium]